jgi:endonuclease/exonuclease/phosphatase (EEP) superfamily protein YafD
MRAGLCAAAIAVSACGNGSSAGAPRESSETEEARNVPPPAASSLLLMTYNVNYGVAGDAESMRLIEESGADVVLLQETNRAWEEALRGGLSDVYQHMAFLHADRRAGGLGFLSRHPIELAETKDSPIGWFPAWRAIVESPIGKVQLINLHLRPPSRRGGAVRGYFESQVERLRETEEYLTLVSKDMPVILAGDFNEDARGRSLQHLVSLGFESVLDRFRPWQPTWRWQTAMGEVRWQLDHIVLTRPLRATAAWVVDGGASDHVPVLARIERGQDPS